MKVDLYADIICPWCYIGEHRFFRAIAATSEVGPVEVTLRPFLLDPTAKEPRPVLEYLRGKFGERAEGANRQVGMIAKADGLQWDATKQIVVDTLPAHRVLRLALHEGGRELQHKVMQRLYVAHFAEGANVADPLVLAGLAAEAGMSRDRVEIALAAGEESAEVQSEIAEAMQIGVHAVPTFVFEGRYAVQGAQPLETFQQVLRRVAAETTRPPV